MLEVALLFILSSAHAEPGAAPEDPSSETAATAGFAELLEGAKKLYFQGHRRESLEILEDLQLRYLVDTAAVPWETAAEALVYLGEVYYFLGELDRSQKAWRLVLERAPDHPRLSPFAHPPEVAGEFEILRATVNREIADRPVPEPPAVPAWTVLPLGIPQFTNGQPVRGVLYGALQVGLGAGSIAMFSHIEGKNVTTDPHPDGWSIEEQRRRLNTQRFAVQWPMTLGAYGFWLGSHLDARATWKREHAITTAVTWTPDPQGGVTVAVSGRF